MEKINFTNAYYIKLGERGKWEESSIRDNKAQIGWFDWPLEEINRRDWDSIKKKYQNLAHYKTMGAATTDINALQYFVESTSDDVWITFSKNQLWWCRLGKECIYEDKSSKSRYRLLLGKWNNKNILGETLWIEQIPGSIAKSQGFRGTIFAIKEIDVLRRLINGEQSEIFKHILGIKENLIIQIEKGLKQLHWKDFETLIDLLFRSAGWRRISLLGETMKDIDIVLQEQITMDKYQVQIKSEATLEDFEQWKQKINREGVRKSYFVVHSPKEKLLNFKETENNIEIFMPNRLAKMVIDFGLTDWLLTKIK